MVQSNVAKKQTVTIESLILSAEEIEAKKISANDLYYFALNGETYGPIFKEALKNNLEYFDPQGMATVRQLDQEDWRSAYGHPYFQRRKLQAVSDDLQVGKEHTLYLIDQSGLKKGPYSLSDIEQMVQSKTTRLTDLVSIDEGRTWVKLYQIEQFDRRKIMPSSKLPELPQERVLKLATTDQFVEVNQTEEAVVGLAIISNINSNKAQDKNYQQIVDKQNTQSTKVKSNSSIWPMLLVIAGFIGSLVWYFTLDKSMENTRETAAFTAPATAVQAPSYTAPKVQKTTSNNGPSFGKSKVVNRINPNLPNTRSYQRKAFKDSDAYEIRNDINDTAIQADFVEGEMIMPEAQLSDEELLELESKLSNRFNITPAETKGEGPASEEGLFDEETSY